MEQIINLLPTPPPLIDNEVGEVFLILRKDGTFLECHDSIESAELSYKERGKKFCYRNNWDSYYKFIAERIDNLSDGERQYLIEYSKSDSTDPWDLVIRRAFAINTQDPKNPERVKMFGIIDKIRELNFVEFTDKKMRIEDQLIIHRVPIKNTQILNSY